jgi:purine catabolism regulator
MQLADLIAHRPLRLELATAGARLDRAVKGAHAIDFPQPSKWIGSGYVVLTTGVGVRGSSRLQREFVHEVADADATALGFAVDVVFRAMPKPMLDAAVERRLPVFNVPYEIPFRDIVRYVTASTLQDDAGRLARVIAVQDDLLAAIERPDGERELVDRLGSLLGARVALFAADGRVLAVAGHPPLKELWGLASSGVRAAPFGPRGYALVQEVESGGYLAVLLRSARHADSVARPVARFAARAVNALAAGRRVAAETDRLARSSLLRDLLDAPHIDRELAGRLRAFGFQPAQPVRVLVARSPANLSHTLHAAVEGALGQGSPSLLVDSSGCEVVAAWHGADIADALRGALPEGGRAGVSSSVVDFFAFAQAVAEARAALAVARDGVVSYESLGLADALLALLPRGRSEHVSDALAPLRDERPEVLQTLRSYFEHDLDIMTCARALHLHPNSLRYRLAKIEKALGRSLRSPQTIADVYLALRAYEVLEGGDRAPPRSE